MKKWFESVTTVEELRKQYKQLLLKYHPDNQGSVADTQEINAECNRLFKARGKENRTNANHYKITLEMRTLRWS